MCRLRHLSHCVYHGAWSRCRLPKVVVRCLCPKRGTALFVKFHASTLTGTRGFKRTVHIIHLELICPQCSLTDGHRDCCRRESSERWQPQ